MKILRPGLCLFAVLLLSACVGNQKSASSGQSAGSSGSGGPSTLNVADAAIAGGDPTMALSVSQSILSEHPDNVDALVHEGDAYYALGRCPASEAAYRLALNNDPKSSVAETGLARCLLKTDPAAAEQALEAAVTDDPGNADALNDLGIARDLQGNFAGAVDPYQKALLANPELTGAEVNLGLSLALSGNGAGALQYLGPLATGPTATPKIREDYAAALVAAGRNDEARQVLAIDLPPDQVNAALQGFAAVIAQNQSAQQNFATPPAPAPTVPAVSTTPVSMAPEPPMNADKPAPLLVSDASSDAPKPLRAKATKPAAPMHAAHVPMVPAAEDSPAASSATGGQEVQLGALPSNDAAQHDWDHLSAEYPALFGNKTPDIEEAVVKGKTYYRLRVGGFDTRADAAKFCGEVLAAGKTCTVANFK
jgi:Flp pilus assembly protein TadD